MKKYLELGMLFALILFSNLSNVANATDSLNLEIKTVRHPIAQTAPIYANLKDGGNLNPFSCIKSIFWYITDSSGSIISNDSISVSDILTDKQIEDINNSCSWKSPEEDSLCWRFLKWYYPKKEQYFFFRVYKHYDNKQLISFTNSNQWNFYINSWSWRISSFTPYLKRLNYSLDELRMFGAFDFYPESINWGTIIDSSHSELEDVSQSSLSLNKVHSGSCNLPIQNETVSWSLSTNNNFDINSCITEENPLKEWDSLEFYPTQYLATESWTGTLLIVLNKRGVKENLDNIKQNGLVAIGSSTPYIQFIAKPNDTNQYTRTSSWTIKIKDSWNVISVNIDEGKYINWSWTTSSDYCSPELDSPLISRNSFIVNGNAFFAQSSVASQLENLPISSNTGTIESPSLTKIESTGSTIITPKKKILKSSSNKNVIHNTWTKETILLSFGLIILLMISGFYLKRKRLL